MLIFRKITSYNSIIIFSIMILLIAGFMLIREPRAIKVSSDDIQVDDDKLSEKQIEEFFKTRISAYLNTDTKLLKSLYYTETRSGRLAYENEEIKLNYIKDWANKQGIAFKEINSYIATRRINEIAADKYEVSLAVSTEYIYQYMDEDIQTSFSIGSYHTMEFKRHNDRWLVTMEWYGDPFRGFIEIDDLEKIRNIISSAKAPDLSNLNERRISAVDYANKHTGVAMHPDYSFHYNNEYRNYNGHGGDCTNFASQVLHEGGRFSKTSSWNYNAAGVTASWVRANSFLDYMLYSGRASLIARGSYEDVLEHSYKLLPGDYIAYERKGKIAHISIVTDFDNKGYPLVNSHNTDRYKVPWDIGWCSKDVKMFLVRVHY